MYALTDYDFNLPETLIAQAPEAQRDRSRLLTLDRRSRKRAHQRFFELCDFLTPNDVLVVNNTQVVPARLFGRKKTGGRVELLILDYATGMKSLAESGQFQCQCLLKASKGPKPGAQILFEHGLTAQVVGFTDGVYTIRFSCEGDFETCLYQIGQVPLPPYIKRDENVSIPADRTSYQTVYATQKGAAAAPTAGLHFSESLLSAIKNRGVAVVPITLHVGYGTFRPVQVPDIRDHRIHAETYHVPQSAADIINQAKSRGSRIIAVGTTCVRTLEFTSGEDGLINAGTGTCELFIYPGYGFKIVDAMITNFHLPKSTLLMLVSAFAGRDMILAAYQDAVARQYRFFSYGDAMFIY
ncbi:MAG: tRNA preQ1(34) S-adenosylmethionine ribosyltransferase-isomerase QueA [Deltaproteobacteria bacterium]|nr:tRNA preQ1(34) S-adenosylmethionine ribosyltransferase-isomerase QueA [Deltaproteobacteria bacterium]